MKKKLAILFGCLVVCMICLYTNRNSAIVEFFYEHMRSYEFFRNYENEKLCKIYTKRYKEKNIIYSTGLQSYTVFGDYLNYGKTVNTSPSPSDRIKLDDHGIEKVKYGDKFYYNPARIAQRALAEYGKALNAADSEDYGKFLTMADALIKLQREDGAFPYDFEYPYYLTKKNFAHGWISGLAQGQALSVYARAWLVTKDEKYIQAGNKALACCLRPVSGGGTMSTLEDLDPALSEYIFFQEYISTPNNYTLNGFMFALLGLYDWKEIIDMYGASSANPAKAAFDKGVTTLKEILPYYDIGGFSTYDLGYKTFKGKKPHIIEDYHAYHIILLHALFSVTDEEILKEYEMKWRQYVD